MSNTNTETPKKTRRTDAEILEANDRANAYRRVKVEENAKLEQAQIAYDAATAVAKTIYDKAVTEAQTAYNKVAQARTTALEVAAAIRDGKSFEVTPMPDALAALEQPEGGA